MTAAAVAQNAPTTVEPPADPCAAAPQANEPAGKPDASSGAKSLTDQLDRCGGVLKPPSVGDAQIHEPPPDAGNTPIIRPGDVPVQPEQQPDQN
jgi:hypothetical protein